MTPTEAMSLVQRVHVAKLLGPPEAAAEGDSLIQRPAFDGYLLHVPVLDAHIRRFERQNAATAFRFPVYPLPSGVMLAVPTLQVGAFQMRVAVPLTDAKSCEWVHWCIDSAKAAWLLEVEETSQAVKIESRQQFPSPEQLRALVRRSQTTAPAKTVLPDIVAAMVQFVDNDAVPSCFKGVRVTDVHLSLVSDFVVHAGVPDTFAQLLAMQATGSAH